jgi:hypothetical protein
MLCNVIIVNWNGKSLLDDCLSSVIETTYPDVRFLIVDNGSTDGSPEYVQRHYPKVAVLKNNRNLGFAEGNNVGIDYSVRQGAEYVALLNNDTRVEPDWLDALVSAIEDDPGVAICQARQRTWEGTHEIRFRFIPEWAEAEQECVPVTPPGPTTPTPFASGCAMLLRCSALQRIGLLDGRYFMYVEDVDLTLRAWIAGYRVMDVPAAVVYHRMLGSESRSEQRMFWGYRNQLTTLLKLYEPATLRRFADPILRRWFRTRNRTALRGTRAALVMLPRTLAQRRWVQRNRKAPDTQFLDLCRS